MPGVNQMMASIRNLEMKFGEIQTQIKTQTELRKTDIYIYKDLIRQVIGEEKKEVPESEQKKIKCHCTSVTRKQERYTRR